MKKDLNLLEKFDLLVPIEPSDNWDRKFHQRLQRSERKPAVDSGSRLMIFAILLLLAFNLFSFSNNWLKERSLQSSNNMRNIASDYLISTNSSKF